jgi:hypothetical protein
MGGRSRSTSGDIAETTDGGVPSLQVGSSDGCLSRRAHLGIEAASCLGSGSGGPASFGQGPSLLGHSPGPVKGPAQQHLDLGVEAAELIGRPLGQGIMDSRIHPQ